MYITRCGMARLAKCRDKQHWGRWVTAPKSSNWTGSVGERCGKGSLRPAGPRTGTAELRKTALTESLEPAFQIVTFGIP